MDTTKIFANGRSQAVRLPKNCRFDDNEVMINKIGEIVIIVPKNNKWNSFYKAIDMFTDDFMKDGRGFDVKQKRESL